MNAAFDWYATAMSAAAVGGLVWVITRARLPTGVRLAAAVVAALVLAAALWNIAVVTMPSR